MRVSIKNHNQAYLQALSQELGCDVSETLNYLLLTLKHDNYYFQKSNQTPVPQAIQSSNYFIPNTLPTGFTANNHPDFLESYSQELAQKTDPIIERMASLIEAF